MAGSGMDPESRIIVNPDTECWEWQGGCDSDGYGTMYWQGKNVSTHRHMYEKYKGAIPEGLVIDHECQNNVCCNPEHLEPVTRAENTRRVHDPERRRTRKMTKRPIKQYAARMPDDLYAEAKTVADAQGVSFNSFLTSAVRSAVSNEVSASAIATRGMNVVTSSAVPTNYVVVVADNSSLSDVITTLSRGATNGEEEQEDPEAS